MDNNSLNNRIFELEQTIKNMQQKIIRLETILHNVKINNNNELINNNIILGNNEILDNNVILDDNEILSNDKLIDDDLNNLNNIVDLNDNIQKSVPSDLSIPNIPYIKRMDAFNLSYCN